MKTWEPFLADTFDWIKAKREFFATDASQVPTVHALYARLVKSFGTHFQSSTAHLNKFFKTRFTEFRKYVIFLADSTSLALG